MFHQIIIISFIDFYILIEVPIVFSLTLYEHRF